MKTIFFFILMILSVQIYAEEAAATAANKADKTLEEKKSNFQLNAKYKAGAFLVYDCRGEYYACVDQDGSDKCREERDLSLQRKETRLPCAPLKKFADKQTCLKKNYEVLESLAVKRFCYPK